LTATNLLYLEFLDLLDLILYFNLKFLESSKSHPNLVSV